MPRRTNQFQRIVHALIAAARPLGGTVKESVELPERTSGTTREVDILVEVVTTLGLRIRIAVETRGRKDKDDVQRATGTIPTGAPALGVPRKPSWRPMLSYARRTMSSRITWSIESWVPTTTIGSTANGSRVVRSTSLSARATV
jgi:hypothetical protein